MSTAVRWLAPELGLDRVVELYEHEQLRRPPTLEEVQAIEQSAYQDGLARGHAEGLAQGQGEIRRLAAQFEGIVDNFSRPLDRLENEVMAALSELSVRIARSLVGRAFQQDPALLAELARAAVDAVGGASREVEVRMHPDDIAALAATLDLPEAARLTGDTSLGRGNLRVHAENMRIDGSLDARIEGALAAVLSQQGRA